MPAKFMYRGKDAEELKRMSLEEFSSLVPSTQRRSLRRGMTETQKKLLREIRKGKDFVKTHCRDIVVIPEMIGRKLGVYNGKDFVPVEITPEMVGHRLGEFSIATKDVKHSAPGFGATKSSKYIPLK